jgi:serine phosphatase RsbU (regulator of sigma subunit)
MNDPSITSTESFAWRAQRSEATRVLLWIAVLVVMIVLTVSRRLEHGVVMTRDEVFYPYVGVLVFAVIGQAVLFQVLRRAERRSILLPDWLWRASAIVDLVVVAAVLMIAALWSPRGPVAALTAPPLLLMPLVILLSILRLRPRFSLLVGLAAAAIHLLLAVRAVIVARALPETYPVYLSYGVIVSLTAVAASFVAGAMRTHVREAANEAAAHERAEREVLGMRHDLSVARDIQVGLLPTRSPQIGGFEVTGMNRPAEQTGGDYYDWQQLPDGKLAVVLADVSGHGIGPALVMAVCRAYARATAPTTADPAALLSQLNTLLHGDLPSDRFITLVLAVLDEEGGIRLASAGHGPTLLYLASTGEVVQFGGDGIPLGIYPTEDYGPTTSLTLGNGDVLMMLTDGFFEWARPGDGEAFGIPRLSDALRASASADAATILRSIDDAVRRFCGGTPQSDDMTAVVIKRTAPTPRLQPASLD